MVTVNDIIQWIITNYELVSISTIILIFAVISIRYFRNKDEDPESIFFIILAVLFGAISVIPSVLLSLLFLIFIPDAYAAVIVAPIAEEIGKAIFVGLLARIRLVKNPMEGFIYGAMVGTGFAIVENFLYAYTALLESGLFEGLFLASFRSVFIVLGHPLYTALTGLGIGMYVIGKSSRRYGTIWQAMLLHAMWNGTMTFFGGYWLYAFIGIIVLSFIIMKIQISRAKKYS